MHTLHSGTRLYSPYMAVPPSPPPSPDHVFWYIFLQSLHNYVDVI